MLSALLYLQYQSFRNRLAAQVGRLRQPKYLVFAIIGAAYFYFYFVRPFHYPGAREKAHSAPQELEFYQTIFAIVLFLFALGAWIFPYERVALTFSEAEVSFLFPAPITRHGLLHFKLLRSQAAILLSTVFMTLISRRFGGNTWIQAAGWWLILSTLSLHFLGSSFARTRLLDRGITNSQRRIAFILVLVGLLIAALAWTDNAVLKTDLSKLDTFSKAQAYTQQIFSANPWPYVLFPFRCVVRPYFATDVRTFFTVVWPALGLSALHYVWVARSNVAFEEASLGASKRLAERIAAARAGNWQSARRKEKAKRFPFRLAPTGFPPVALLWKNLISAGQAFSVRIWISLAAVALGAAIASHRGSADSLVLPSVGIVAFAIVFWSLLFAPQTIRQDFRQDLLLADTLKLFPLPGWQIALGEVLAPVVILSALQWISLILLIGFFPGRIAAVNWPLLLAGGFAGAIVFPVMNLVTLLILNIAVLLFPGWVHVGKNGPQGIEGIGQRLVFMFGQLIVLVLALAPAGAAALGVFLGAEFFVGIAGAIPLAAIGAAIMLGCEAVVGVKLLGWLFDRLDLSAELHA